MKEEFTLTVYSENVVGLLNQVTTVFTRRHINIESITASASAIEGIHKITIVIFSSLDQVEKLAGQIEKRIDVLKAYFFRTHEIVYQEIALYKVPTKSLLEGNQVEQLVRKHGARILEMTEEYVVIQKTGHKEETQDLFEKLHPYGLTQFTRSGRVAVNRLKKEPLNTWLKSLEEDSLKVLV
ncbi:MAG: acetolactate synthase small subunit [Bacteroidetes bacterium]|nr:MAG: acetolactate synthase small subunit [Bacteroidota bacterium]